MATVLYGHGIDPVHITLPGHDTMMAPSTERERLLEIELDDNTQLALPRQVQCKPIKCFLEQVDLRLVPAGERVVIDVPIHVAAKLRPTPSS